MPHITKSASAKKSPSRYVKIDKKVLFLAVSLVAIVSFIIGTREYEFRAIVAQSFGFQSKDTLDMRSVEQTYQYLKQHYDGKLDSTKLIEGANKGLVAAAGDEYTVYLTAEEAQKYADDINGQIGGGVGIEIATRNKAPTIIRVLPDNPAAEAGLQKNDVIEKINDESVAELTIGEVSEKIRGDVGSTVKMTVRRGGDSKVFSVTRKEVKNPSVTSEVKNGVGIIKVSRFDNETVSLSRKAANDLLSKGVKSVILDLRGDGGGYVDSATGLLGLWVDDKVVLTQRSKGQVVDEVRANGDTILGDLPTVVLVDEGTASASEIVAGALRDYDKATLVGVKTFGKGSVQQIFNLDGGAELKVTIAKWYTPSGTNINDNGLKPDVVIKITQKDLDEGRDPQLAAAISELTRK